MKDPTKSIEERIETIGNICNQCGNQSRYVVEMKVSGWPVEIFVNTLKYYSEHWQYPDAYIIPDSKSHFTNNSILLVGPNTCLCEIN